MLYCSWHMACNGFIFHFGLLFALLPPITAWKIKISKNWKKTLEISFYSFTKNHDHMLYCSWDMVHGCNCYYSYWSIFCSFTPHNSPKKWKKSLEISSFYTSASKIMIICYTFPEILHVTHIIVICHFGLFFALLPP